MAPDAEADSPKYWRIAEDLRAQVLSGERPPGSQLPGENQLADEYSVARGTARRALAVLQTEGLAVARKGAGVFVRDGQPILRNAVQRLSADQWGSGRSIWEVDVDKRPMAVDSIRVYEDEAPERIARVLDTSTVWIRERRYLVDGTPVMLATSYLPADLVAGSRITDPDPGEGGIYARLQDLGLKPVRFREQVRGRPPSPEEVDRLALSVSGAPVLTIARVAYAVEDRPIEVNEMVLDAAVYILQYDFTS